MSVVESFGISTKPKKQSALQTLPQNILFGGMAGVSFYSLLFFFFSFSQRSDKYFIRSSSVERVAPEKAIKLSVNDMLCSFLSDEQGKTSLMNSIIAGAGAGFCQVIATCPMEMLMITFQTRSSQGQPIHSVTQLVKELGIRGIYKGLIATLCRDVPFSSSERLAIPYVFVSGIGAGCLAAVLSTPMDVIKTRLQSSHSPYRGIVDCFVRTLHEDGITKFFSGSIARACIVSPLFGIALLFYEFQKRLASPS
ncbi:Mitochondrial substrate carrier family protein X [Galdieria sulphuraria]|nr:Mitochondrial substrate carrier family protein X [Galdieria sulphuraria]